MWEYQDTEDLIYVFLIPLICIPGLVAATASAYVFFKIRSSSLEVLLFGLSLFDVAVLGCSLTMYPSLNQCKKAEEGEDPNPFVCHFFWKTTIATYPFAQIAQAGSVWTCVAVTVDRFVAVSFPIKKRIWCTPMTSTITLCALTGFCILYKFPAFFELELNAMGVLSQTSLRSSPTYQLYYNVFAYSIVMLVLPWTIIIILNFIVILRVREAYGRRCHLAKHSLRRSVRRRDDAERRCTIMAVVMISLFFFLNPPSLINHLIEAIMPPDRQPFRERIPISNLLVCINSASNILIYCVFNRKFRRTIGGLLGIAIPENERRGVLERAGSFVITGFAVRMMASQWKQRSNNGSLKSNQTRFGDVSTPLEGETLLGIPT
ncbi:unnamed protein product, partial [Mesorhabditis belari]|uniref:G-protein coupled receptors family 1 profile domain-containing protein n=1 Tax=Mesorhabditis belari TaxID=2138241 RepID=A0AAF3FNI8_9BILA